MPLHLRPYLKNSFIYYAYGCCLLLCSLLGKAQNAPSPNATDAGKTIEIVQARELEVITAKGNTQELRKLVGDVILKQGNATMKCDSAYFYSNENNVRAFGHVVIEQGDSVTLKSEQLFYNGNKKIATMSRNVFLTDKKADITADSLYYYMHNRKAVLSRKVHLTDKKSDIDADRLEYFVPTKQAEFYKNIHLKSGETDITSQRMSYNVNSKDTRIVKEAKLVSPRGELSSDSLFYNVNTQQGTYNNGGKLVTKDKTLTSQRAHYDGKADRVKFDDNVLLISPEYNLETPHLDYDLKTEEADFAGATTITSKDGSIIKANSGKYDSRNDRLNLNERIAIQNKGQNIIADRLNYNKKDGYSKAEGNVIMTDTAQNTTLRSQYANFYDKNKRVEAYGNANITNISDNGDTLYLFADTIVSFNPAAAQANKPNNNAKDSKVFYAYKNVKIVRRDLQGVCDSLYYSERDSLFRMYYQPILWSDNYQLNADTITVMTEQNKPRLLLLRSNAFIGNAVQGDAYDQVKGKDITGYFQNGNMHKMIADGNAESIYYAQDDDKKFIGANRSSSGIIQILFAEKAIDKIKFEQKPEATFFPMKEVVPSKFMLRGFQWQAHRRPNFPPIMQ
jgi:lipopolysaccharide export system protein LptA